MIAKISSIRSQIVILYNSDRQGPREELVRAQGGVLERAQEEEEEEQEVSPLVRDVDELIPYMGKKKLV